MWNIELLCMSEYILVGAIGNIWIMVSIYFNKCKIQLMNNDFNILKMNDSTYVHLLIIEKIWKKYH
jgi:hypothetical protein